MMNLSKNAQSTTMYIICFMVVLTIAAMDLFVPSLPAMMDYFNVDKSDVQWLVAIYMFGFSLAHVFFGALSDFYGRRPVLLSGLIIGVIGSLMIVITSSFSVVILGRLLQGVGFAAISLLSRTILRDYFKDEMLAKAGSTVGIVASITVGLAPSVGGLTQLLGSWKIGFLLILLLAVITLVLVYYRLPETMSQEVEQHEKLSLKYEINHYLKVLFNSKFIMNTLLAGLAFGGMLAYAILGPFIIQNQLHFNSFEFGLLSVLIALVQIMGYKVNGKIVTKCGLVNNMMLGSASFLLAGVLLICAALLDMLNIYSLMLGLFLFVFGTGFIYSNAYSAAFSLFDAKVGNVAAVYGLVQIGCAFLVSSIFIMLPSKTMLILGLSYVVLAIASFLILTYEKNASRSSGLQAGQQG